MKTWHKFGVGLVAFSSWVPLSWSQQFPPPASSSYHVIGSPSRPVIVAVSNPPTRPTSSPNSPAVSKGAATTDLVISSSPKEKNQAGASGFMLVLRDAHDALQREWAAERLAGVAWPEENNDIVAILLKAARLDSAPMVRVHCIRTLALKNLNTVPVLTTIRALKADADPRVQHEVDIALVRLGVNTPTSPTLSPALNHLPGRSN